MYIMYPYTHTQRERENIYFLFILVDSTRVIDTTNLLENIYILQHRRKNALILSHTFVHVYVYT